MSLLQPRTPQRPLIWPDALLDIQAIVQDYPTPVYVVGGAVRDAYLHRPVHDFDLATPQNAIQLGRHIANRLKGDFYVLDSERDVARVLAEMPFSAKKIEIDIARFRGNGLLADLQDRDFTVNAMAVDLCGDLNKLIDPLNGEQDLLDKVLRQCNTASIADDPIRALRAIRQSVQLKARIEPKTLNAIRSIVSRLAETSPERIRDELFKLLSVSRPVAALRVADTLGLLSQIIPEVALLHEFDEWQYTLAVVEKLHGLLTILRAHRSDNSTASFDFGVAAIGLGHLRPQLEEHIAKEWPGARTHEGVLLLAALLHAVGRTPSIQAENMHSNDAIASEALAINRIVELRLSNDEKIRVATMVRCYSLVQQMALTDLELHRFWRERGVAGVDVCLLALASYLGTVGLRIDQKYWVNLVERVRDILNAYYNRHEQVVAPPPLLSGNDLMQTLSLKPGKLIGKLLTLIREGQVMGDITTVDEAMAAARDYLTSG